MLRLCRKRIFALRIDWIGNCFLQKIKIHINFTDAIPMNLSFQGRANLVLPTHFKHNQNDDPLNVCDILKTGNQYFRNCSIPQLSVH